MYQCVGVLTDRIPFQIKHSPWVALCVLFFVTACALASDRIGGCSVPITAPDECMWIKTTTGASQSVLDVLVDECLAELAAEETRQQEYKKKLEELDIPLEGRTI